MENKRKPKNVIKNIERQKEHNMRRERGIITASMTQADTDRQINEQLRRHRWISKLLYCSVYEQWELFRIAYTLSTPTDGLCWRKMSLKRWIQLDIINEELKLIYT